MRRLFTAAAIAGALAAPAAGIGETEAHLRVGYVTDARATTDGGVGERFYRGFVRAVRELGADGRVLEVSPGQDPEAALATLGRQRYDLIIAGTYIGPDQVNAIALRFPRSRFLFVGGPSTLLAGQPTNTRGLLIHVEQAGYLAGYLAGLMETRRPGTDVIGAVGGVPSVPDVANYILGYRTGARRADPRITVLTAYSNNFVNPAKCRAVALGQIAAHAGAVFQVAGSCGLGALQAAKARHVWGIGVDVDQSALGPHILTSAVLRPEAAIFLAITALRNGTFGSGADIVLTLGNGGVGLGKISPKVPKEFRRRLDRVRAQIVAGKIRVPTRFS